MSLQKWKYVAVFLWRLVNHDFNHSANLFMPHFWTLASFLTMVSGIKRNASPRSALASRDSRPTESSQPWNDTSAVTVKADLFNYSVICRMTLHNKEPWFHYTTSVQLWHKGNSAHCILDLITSEPLSTSSPLSIGLVLFIAQKFQMKKSLAKITRKCRKHLQIWNKGGFIH